MKEICSAVIMPGGTEKQRILKIMFDDSKTDKFVVKEILASGAGEERSYENPMAARNIFMNEIEAALTKRFGNYWEQMGLNRYTGQPEER